MKILLMILFSLVYTTAAFSQAENPPITPKFPPPDNSRDIPSSADDSNGFDLRKSPQAPRDNNSLRADRPDNNVVRRPIPPRPITTLQKCQSMRLSAPKFSITRVRSGPGFLSGTYEIEGALEGTCIDEAGYYESGQLIESLGADYSHIFTRHEFRTKVRTNKYGELRIRLTDGTEVKITSEELAAQSESLF